jgi:nitrous oxidase accessory protein
MPRNERGDCIHLWDGRNVVIKGNTVSNCRDGIYMELSTDCLVEGNTITDSRYSVHTMWCDRSAYNDNVASGNLVGLALMFSKAIEARNNKLYDNQTHGILLTQVTRAQITDNVIIANTKGLFVYNSLYNTISGNLVARNNLGMHYWGGSEDNELTDNMFIGNEIQVKFVAAYDQAWDGNFWSDYLGWDRDGDGRGDEVYHSNTLVDSLLWKFPIAKLLLASPALQMLAMAERSFPVITVPKGVDSSPRMLPSTEGWESILEQYPSTPRRYYGRLAKLPHIPGER